MLLIIPKAWKLHPELTDLSNLTFSQFNTWPFPNLKIGRLPEKFDPVRKTFCWPCGLWIIDSAPERIARLWRLSSTLKTTFVCWVRDVFLATALNSLICCKTQPLFLLGGRVGRPWPLPTWNIHQCKRNLIFSETSVDYSKEASDLIVCSFHVVKQIWRGSFGFCRTFFLSF